LFKHHLAPLADKKLRYFFEGAARTVGHGACSSCLILADKRNMAEIGRHREITSLKSPHAR
jgi:hypothetical protein